MENQKKWFEFVARYQGDSEFAAKVDADPAGELTRFGVPVPEGAKVNLVKNSANEFNVVIPRHNLGDLNEDELGNVQGGSGAYGGAGGCSCGSSCFC